MGRRKWSIIVPPLAPTPPRSGQPESHVHVTVQRDSSR